MSRSPKALLAIVGIVGALAALLGLFYNLKTLETASNGGFSNLVSRQRLLHFYLAFYVMSAICIICYILLLLCCIDLLKMRLRLCGLLTGVLLFEIVYLILIALAWLDPTVGISVAAATGVANGGLMIQFVILFPLWAPVVVWWAKGKLDSVANQ